MKKYSLLLLVVILLSQPIFTIENRAIAQISTDQNQISVDPLLKLESGEKLLLTEVNFKNKSHDFLKFTYQAVGTKTINLKGLLFQSDQVLKKVTTDFWMKNGDEMTLEFKNSAPDNVLRKTLFTAHSGLVSTNEQIMIRSENQIFDAICWSNSKPTTKEKNDLQKLFTAKAWTSADPESCFPSPKVGINESIIRKNLVDHDTKEDWIVKKKATPLPQKKLTNSRSEKASKNLSQSKAKLNSKKTSPRLAQKRDPQKINTIVLPSIIATDIIIDEFLPNPPKGHADGEWIELFNQSGHDIDLGGWQLDDEEKGSKPWIIPKGTIIKAKKFLVISRAQSHLVLGNTHDEVRLFNRQKQLVQRVTYEKAEAGSSYSFNDVQKEDGSHAKKWFWEKHPTPNQLNPFYQEMEGILEGNVVLKNPNFFLLEIMPEKKLKKIFFDEDTLPGTLAKVSFTKGAKVKILASANADGIYRLRSYEIISSPNSQNFSAAPMLFFIIAGVLIVMLVSIKYIGSKMKNRV